MGPDWITKNARAAVTYGFQNIAGKKYFISLCMMLLEGINPVEQELRTVFMTIKF